MRRKAFRVTSRGGHSSRAGSSTMEARDGRTRKANIIAKAKKIKLVIFDIDGVMTDGRLYFDPQGKELKVFHVHDGLGIKLLQSSGVIVAVITSRQSLVVEQRLKSLGVSYIYQGQLDKRIAFKQLLNDLQLKENQVAYVGDDLADLPLIQCVGLGIAVANAQAIIKQQAVWQTALTGGAGAVREVCEFIMKAQGTINLAYEKYL